MFPHRLLPWNGSKETRHLVRIAWPLTFSAVTNMALAITDVIMMGWISPLALGAGAAISDIYSIVFYLCAGVAAAGIPILAGMIGARDPRGLGGVLLEVCVATLGAGVSSFLVGIYLVGATSGLLIRDAVLHGTSARIKGEGIAVCWRTGIPIGVSSLGDSACT